MAEKRTIELDVDTKEAQKSTQSLKSRLKELKEQIALAGDGTEEFKRLSKEAGALKDRIDDVNRQVKNFASDTRKLDVALEGITAASGAFQAFEGTMALVGVESEDLQKTMVKLQAVMSVTNGIQQVANALNKDSALTYALNSAATKGAAAAQGIYTAVVGTSTGALKAFKVALASTGIGAFIVALGAVVAYWDDIKEAVTGISAEQKKYMAQLDKDVSNQEHKVEMLEVQESTLKLQGKSQKEINKLVLKELDLQIEKEEARVAAEKQKIKDSVASTKMWQNALAWYIRISLEVYAMIFRAVALPFDILIEEINIVSEALGQGTLIQKNLNQYISEGLEAASQWGSKLVFDSGEVEAEGAKTIQAMDKNLAVLKNKRDSLKLEERQSNQNTLNQRINSEKAAAKETLDLERELIDKRLALMDEGEAKEKAIAEEKARREKEDLIKSTEGKIVDAKQLAEAQKLIDENLQKELQGITDKYDKIELDAYNQKNAERIKQEDEQFNALQKLKNSQKEQELLELAQSYDAKFEAAKNNAELEKALTEQFNKEQAAIIKKYADADAAKKKEEDEKEKARIKQLNEYRLNAAKDTLQIFSDLNELFAGKSEKQQKKAFQVQKAINIANAVIDTYKAANTALASSPPPFNYIAMAASITAGLLNVKKIASQEFQSSSTSGGGGGGSVPSTPSSMTANFQTIGTSGINQLATLQQQPVQAYVVSGEVTSAQALDRNRVQNATL